MAGCRCFASPSGFANGHTRDRQGRLIGCSHQHRCITRTELDGSITVLADRYAGKRLNSPNDVICRSDGTIWFSDPHYGINTDYEGGKQTAELPPMLYRFDPQDGSLQVMADDFEGPNGLAFSPDERLLYVAESGRQFAADPHSISGSLRCSMAAGGSPRVGSFTRSRRALPTASAWTRTETSGAAPPTACIASRRTARSSEVSKCRSRCRTSPSAAATGRGLFICASHTLFAIYTNQRGAERP